MDQATPGAAAVVARSRTTEAAVLRLGATVSVAQCALFVTIGVAALVLGVDQLVEQGLGSFVTSDPGAFRLLCASFLAIAVLGLAITPAERQLVAASMPAAGPFGAQLAALGHAGTIAYFGWWLVVSHTGTADPQALAALAPIQFGTVWELGFVGAWVWIIAAAARRGRPWPPGFWVASVVKGCCFWAAYAALWTGHRTALAVALAGVTFVAGPLWHLWVARVFVDEARGRQR